LNSPGASHQPVRMTHTTLPRAGGERQSLARSARSARRPTFVNTLLGVEGAARLVLHTVHARIGEEAPHQPLIVCGIPSPPLPLSPATRIAATTYLAPACHRPQSLSWSSASGAMSRPSHALPIRYTSGILHGLNRCRCVPPHPAPHSDPCATQPPLGVNPTEAQGSVGNEP
jgi:hypothetical protein